MSDHGTKTVKRHQLVSVRVMFDVNFFHKLMSNDSCIMSNDSCIMSNDSCIMSNDSCIMSNDSCLMSNDSCIRSRVNNNCS